MARGFALASWVVVIAVLAVGALWGSLWTYTEYKAHRANVMLADASRVRVGDSEASVQPLVRRYDGIKWATEPLGPREQWIDKDEYDYEVNRQSDYRYEIGVGPLWATTAQGSRWTRILRAARKAIPEHLRPLLGLRDWGAVAEFSIRGGHVHSVSAMALFQGKSDWLGHRWEVAEGMPRHEMRQQAYAIGAGNLTMEDVVGEMIENVFTPEASEEQIEAARQFNTGCFTTIRGCDGLCEVAPRALLYLRQHPDAVWNIIPPKCPELLQ